MSVSGEVARRRIPRAGWEAEAHAHRAERFVALAAEGHSWEVLAERLGLEEGQRKTYLDIARRAGINVVRAGEEVMAKGKQETGPRVSMVGLVPGPTGYLVVRAEVPVDMATECLNPPSDGKPRPLGLTHAVRLFRRAAGEVLQTALRRRA